LPISSVIVNRRLENTSIAIGSNKLGGAEGVEGVISDGSPWIFIGI
jgi:hypothetical protein